MTELTEPGPVRPAETIEPTAVLRAIPTLARSRHDRAAMRRDDDAWLRQAWSSARVLPISAEGTVPVVAPAAGGGATAKAAPGAATAGSAADDSVGGVPGRLSWIESARVDGAAPRLFLGEFDSVPYFAVSAQAEDGWLGLRELGAQLGELEAGLLTSAVALSEWHARHVHCPRCGAPTVSINAGWARRCPVDGSEHFPRTDPAVIMLIHDGADRCVLGRQAQWPAGRFSILAGFVEAGESAEGAVAREVYEEVGLRITDIRYRSSQPWPFPASLMLGFTARAVGDTTITRHDAELADAGWFTRAEVEAAATWPGEVDSDPNRVPALRAIPGGVSIARFLIEEWLDADGE